MDYKNPVKSAKLTGKVSGKGKTLDLTSKTKKTSIVRTTNKSTYTNAKFTIEAAKGWKITSIACDNTDKDGDSTYISKSLNKKSKASISLDTLYGKKSSYIDVTFYNTSTGGTITVNYYFNN